VLPEGVCLVDELKGYFLLFPNWRESHKLILFKLNEETGKSKALTILETTSLKNFVLVYSKVVNITRG
jgi:hypothetical protein